MHNESSTQWKPRVTFLLLLAIAISLLFFWMIKGFIVALLVAAILAELLRPFYQRVANRLGGRKVVAAFVTVLLSIALVVIPLLLFVGILVSEAVDVSQTAGEWVTKQIQDQADQTPEKRAAALARGDLDAHTATDGGQSDDGDDQHDVHAVPFPRPTGPETRRPLSRSAIIVPVEPETEPPRRKYHGDGGARRVAGRERPRCERRGCGMSRSRLWAHDGSG